MITLFKRRAGRTSSPLGSLGLAIGISLMLSCPITSLTARADAPAQAGKVVSVDGQVLIRADNAQSGATAKAVPAKPGDVVKEGDVINTSSNGKIKLLMADQTILDLGASSLFKVEKFQVKNIGDRQVDIQMAYGSVRASVSKAINPAAGGKFQIRTRTATMGVRGTEFIVQSEMGAISKKEEAEVAKQQATGKTADGKPVAAAKPQETKITVVQGKVEVAVAAKPQALQLGGRKLASEPKPVPVMLTAGKQLTANVNSPSAQPITLSTTQMASVTSAVKVNDNTFQRAVNMDLTSSGSSSNSGSGNSGGSASGGASGAATLAAITSAVQISMNSASVSSIPLPAAVPVAAAPKPVFVPVGGIKNVHIVVSH